MIGELCQKHLTHDEQTLIAHVSLKHPERLALLMSAHGGTPLTGGELARLVLRLCTRIKAEGGGPS